MIWGPLVYSPFIIGSQDEIIQASDKNEFPDFHLLVECRYLQDCCIVLSETPDLVDCNSRKLTASLLENY